MYTQVWTLPGAAASPRRCSLPEYGLPVRREHNHQDSWRSERHRTGVSLAGNMDWRHMYITYTVYRV